MRNNLRVVSVNVGYGMLMEELLPYVRRQAETTSVFCFQETDHATQLTLDAVLSNEFIGFYATKTGTEGGFHLSTYVRRDLEVKNIYRVLEHIEDTRGALTCHVKDPVTQHTLVITNVHGNSQPGHKLDTPGRILQSQTVINATSKLEGTHIAIGDFNLLPETESVRLFERNGYANLITDFSIPTTRNEIVWKKYPDNIQLFADYAFIKDADADDYTFRVDNDTVSDHLPLILTLTLHQPVETFPVPHTFDTELQQSAA